jgi:hypothetical protein
MVNHVLQVEGTWGSDGIAPWILNFGTGQK